MAPAYEGPRGAGHLSGRHRNPGRGTRLDVRIVGCRAWAVIPVARWCRVIVGVARPPAEPRCYNDETPMASNEATVAWMTDETPSARIADEARVAWLRPEAAMSRKSGMPTSSEGDAGSCNHQNRRRHGSDDRHEVLQIQ